MNCKRIIAVMLLQLAIVSSLGAKLLYDRVTRPHVWVKTTGYDPDMPVRGRYAAMRLQVRAPWLSTEEQPSQYSWQPRTNQARLEICGESLCAVPDPNGTVAVQWSATIWNGMPEDQRKRALQNRTAILAEPVDFYLPEHANDPTWRRDGKELWAEVTVPKSGPPRPLRLGTKTGDGPIVPLDLR